MVNAFKPIAALSNWTGKTDAERPRRPMTRFCQLSPKARFQPPLARSRRPARGTA